jgi:hypothetical protein
MSKAEYEPEHIIEAAEKVIHDRIWWRIQTLETELESLNGKKFQYLYARELVDTVNDLYDSVCETDEDWEMFRWELLRNDNEVIIRQGGGSPDDTPDHWKNY